MPTVKTIDLTCPNCDHQFESSTVDMSSVGGRKRTDFQIDAVGSQPLAHGVHLCERCGFAGPTAWFGNGEPLSYEVSRNVWNELTPRIATTTLPASEKYEFAAKVAAWDGADDRTVADLWLRAAWCCVNEGDVEAERYYRRHAAWNFEEVLGGWDRAQHDDRAVLTYLVGELWRRIGDLTQANDWFDRVAGEARKPEQEWLVRVARQQRDNPLEWFA